MVDLNEMILFARVVSRGSFTEAARELGVPASTLSRKVSTLEERLGVRLLERTTRQIRLTDAGELYYERCGRLSREAEDADRSIMALQTSPKGTLRVTAPPFFAESNLAPVLAEYGRRCPDVQVVLVLADRMVDLVAEGFDLAIRVAAGFSDSSLVLRRGTPRVVNDLDGHSILGYAFESGGDFCWRFVDEQGAVVQKQLTPRIVVNSFWMTRELCRRGEGLAMLPASLAGPDLASDRLVRLLPAMKTRPLDIGVVMPSARQTPAKVRVFLEVMEFALGG
ncbi:MAG: LysR family transcriptional regulator, partial [Polyangiaceae bacterium]|nr:LysR family transcriptional regulator [Polyangiaceae bacterium]